mmetsp:Transcript_5547/g.6903  ORF Transcript_5547/g.6903 Transcript_5547/m.6903 type:complete len:106 (+) Transcript_5547:138-455(+)
MLYDDNDKLKQSEYIAVEKRIRNDQLRRQAQKDHERSNQMKLQVLRDQRAKLKASQNTTNETKMVIFQDKYTSTTLRRRRVTSTTNKSTPNYIFKSSQEEHILSK